jgi:hypothetical protein
VNDAMKLAVVTAVLASACGDVTQPAPVTVEIQVLRGPTTPVCLPNVSCEAPFAASFLLYRSGRLRSRVETGADGRIELHLAPGDYELVPGPEAPVLSPESQRKPIQVIAPGPLEVTLQFDTGIR